MMVARVWAKHGLKPHRLERYMASNDPEFEAKAADIIGLYLNPPQHAAVFCVDEKTAIQALDRKDPVLPLLAGSGRASRLSSTTRHGTLSLYAAFNTQTGEGVGQDGRAPYLGPVRRLPRRPCRQSAARQGHPRHRRQPVHSQDQAGQAVPRPASRRADALHPNLFVPGSTKSKCGSPGSSATSSRAESSPRSPDLKRKLMRYIKHYNKAPNTVKWKYHDPSQRLSQKSVLHHH